MGGGFGGTIVALAEAEAAPSLVDAVSAAYAKRTSREPVGYVCICVATASGDALARDPQLPGGRDDVRDRSVSVAMHMIRRVLIDEDLPL